MKKITNLFTLSLVAGLLLGTSTFAAAQDYEDDLYYSPSRAKKEQQARAAAAAARAQAQAAADQAAGLGASDTYTDGSASPLTMDVDAYNRRNARPNTQAGEQQQTAAFNYTRRIERFHNPDVVSASGDTTLMDYYYSSPSSQDINVYVINSVDPIGGYTPWPYSYNYWNPYSAWNWYTPGWSFSWNFGPIYAGWGWGWNWYDPYWGWNWGWTGPWHGWHHPCPGPVYRPHYGYNRPGASRPHGPAYGGSGNYRPGTNGGYRPGNNGGYRPGSNRPGSMRPGNNGNAVVGGQYRPGNNGNAIYRPGYTPGNNGGSYTPTNNDRRGRNNYGTGSNNSGNRYSSPSNNSGNSYRNNSGNSYRNNSGGSYRNNGGGSYGGGRSGGGSHGGGGGGGRGRGR